MRIRVLSSILIIFSFSHGLFASSADVTSAFSKYRSAILNADADAAYRLVDSNTKNYYGEMLKVILYANKEQSSNMPATAKIFIVQSRHRIPAETLKSFDGEKLFKYAVSNGWIGKKSIASFEITDIEVNQDSASSKIKKGEKTAPFGFAFRKESENWKIDLTSILPMTESALKQAIKNANQAEDDFIFKAVETLSGKKVSPTVWDPIIKK